MDYLHFHFEKELLFHSWYLYQTHPNHVGLQDVLEEKKKTDNIEWYEDEYMQSWNYMIILIWHITVCVHTILIVSLMHIMIPMFIDDIHLKVFVQEE